MTKKKGRTKRKIERGTIRGEITPSGVTIVRKPKGIQHWYSTRELIEKVTSQMDSWEMTHGTRVCHINGKWQLQIRGKHLRRLLKAMPNVKQKGRVLIEET